MQNYNHNGMWINTHQSLYALPLAVDNISSSCFDYQFTELLAEIQVQVLMQLIKHFYFDTVEGWITSSNDLTKVM